MKKERAIIIKDPRLRRIRNEFRNLLQSWTSKVRSDLQDKAFVYIENHEDDKLREINIKVSNLDIMEEKSIILCPDCGRRDQDMVYVPTIPSTNEWNVPNPYATYTHEWICMDCNSKRVHIADLREEILTGMTMMDIEEFLDRLSGGEGVGLSRSGWKCNGYEESERILFEMGIEKDTQGKFLELCGHYGGYCDCEILLNAA
ncbi:hypothetical protein LCGC14_1414030 [marine sediment metagenome]|uniref:DUF2695 domain-containing protein n=1 Tax=marine sediment metagenome TaxID=412755 RepID=A0A0F9JTD1_9ZZZZ